MFTPVYSSMKTIVWILFIFAEYRYVYRMDELGFYVPSTVFQSIRDDVRVNMKGSVQRSAVYVREESRLQRDSNPRPRVPKSGALTARPPGRF